MIPHTGDDRSSGSTNDRSTSELGEFCAACENPYPTVYYLPDEVWDLIAAGASRLCLPCADARARKLGIELYWEAREGEFPGAFMRRVQAAIAETKPILDRLAET